MTDMVMPLMGGKELSEHFTKLHPQAKVLYVSGYSDDNISHWGVLNEEIDFIPKPFAPLDLLRKVRKTLDKESAPILEFLTK